MEKKYDKKFQDLSPNEMFMEIVYQRLLGLVNPAYAAINRAYSVEERRKNPKTDYLYKEACAQAKQHLSYYKSVIRDSILPFAKIKLHASAYNASEDKSTQDLRKLVLGQFTMLKNRLIDYAGLMLPKEDVAGYLDSLNRVFHNEHEYLLNGLIPTGIICFEAVPRYLNTDDYLKSMEKNINLRTIDISEKIKKLETGNE